MNTPKMILGDDNLEPVLARVIDRPDCNFIDMHTLSEDMLADTIYNINIRGLKNNLGNLEEFLNQLQYKAHAKAITLTEIFNADHNEKNNYVESHTLVSACRTTNKNRGGVGVLIHESLQFTTANIEHNYLEDIFESITVIIKDIKAIIVSIYRPTGCAKSNPRDFNNFLTMFLEDLKGLKEYKEYTTFIQGDFNYNLRNMHDKNTSDYVNIMIENLFVPTNCECDTRTTNTSSTLIDHIWTNMIERIESAFVIEDMYISDHKVNGITLKDRQLVGKKKILTRKITDEKKEQFRTKLDNTDWTEILSEQDCDRKWEKLTKIIQETLDETCPCVEKVVSTEAKPSKTPWITEGLRQSEQALARLMKKANKHPNTIEAGQTINNWDLFRQYRKTHSKTRRAAKRKYYDRAFTEVKHDAKKTWELISNFTKTKKENNHINELIENGVSLKQNKDMAECFNRFYSRVGTTQAATIPNTETSPADFLTDNHPGSIFLGPCTPEEVWKTCKKLAKKKSKGPDSIPTNMIIACINELKEVLADCINSSFTTGKFPACLKQANVVPLYKKKARTDPTNYRPVSLLNSLSKVIEKVIYTWVYQFMENKLCWNQFGFRPNHSTTDLMIFTVENICRQLDQKGYSIPLYFDLGKAFDTLPHTTLLQKLEYYGIRGIALDLMSSYLSERSQTVIVNNTPSSPAEINIGVPQGSILGPLLFIIYINDIQKAAPNATIGCYADDTTAIIPGNTPQQNISLAKDALNKLGDWFSANKLSLSPTKCKYALMNKNRHTATWNTTLEIYGKHLTEIRKDTDSSSNPLVGLLMTEKLSYDEHTKALAGKLRSGIYALKANRHLPNIAKKNIYFACIHSHISYAGIIIGTAPVSCTKQISTIQRKAIRILANAGYNDPANESYRKLHIMKAEDIFKTQACIYGWKFIHQKLPKAIAQFMEPCNDRTLHIKYNRFNLLTLKQLSPIDFITREWNQLPLHIKESPSINVLKKSLCTYYIEGYP